MIKRRYILMAFAALIMMWQGAVQARTLDEILKSGTIKVGVNPTYAPLALYNEKNEFDGFDVDIAKRLADMLKVKLELVSVSSVDRVPFLVGGKVDVVMAGLTRTTERAKVVDFTVPTHTEALGVLTTAAKPYKHWKDLNDPSVKLVEVRGSTAVKWVQDNLPKAQLQLLDELPDVVRLLSQGRADAHVNIIDLLGTYMKQYKVEWKVLESPISVDYDCIGVPKDAAGVRDWLNVALFDLWKTGFMDRTYEKWFGRKMLGGVQPSPFF